MTKRESLLKMNETLVTTVTSQLTIQKTSKILKCLSSDDAYKIFLKAKEGLPRTTDAHIILGMSSKRYYSSLKKVVSSRLLLRKRSGYFHSALGSLVYKSVVSQLENDLVDYMGKAGILKAEYYSNRESIR